MSNWYVYESRFQSGKLSNFAVIPEETYQRIIAKSFLNKSLYNGPFSENEANQIARQLQKEWEDQQK